MTTGVLLALIGGCFCAASGQVLLKIGATGRTSWYEFVNAYVAVGLSLYAAGTILWIFALSKEKLTHVFPFTLLTFVLVLLAGTAFLGERISPLAAVGMLVVLVGLALVAAGA